MVHLEQRLYSNILINACPIYEIASHLTKNGLTSSFSLHKQRNLPFFCATSNAAYGCNILHLYTPKYC